MAGLAFPKAHTGLKKTSEKPGILAALPMAFCLWVLSKGTNYSNMDQPTSPGTCPTPSQSVTGSLLELGATLQGTGQGLQRSLGSN